MGKERGFLQMVVGVWVCALVCAQAGATTIEFVSQTQAKELAAQFSTSRVLEADDLVEVRERDIRCDMYGMRTRLQVERGVRLYNFKQDSAQWHNRGAQVVADYRLDAKRGLVGVKGSFRDEIRKTEDGRLLSHLTINGNSGPVSIAFSVCSATP